CFQLTQANFSGTTGFYRLPPCDTLLFLRRVLDVAPDLTVEGIRTAAEQLGTSYDSPVSFANHLAPGRYDGGDAYRLIYFDDGCTCYRFTGGNHPMPQ
ncbi:MAG: hypothetical protein JOZ37_16115, partial [Actinobacteria bacterium]|nr:hypothetical protein [Actinomycetota bacterium]